MSDQIIHAVAGAGGGALSLAVTYPLITMSTRAQVNIQDAKLSNIDAVRQALTETGGIKRLYSGLDSALWGVGLTNFVYYYFYEGIKSIYMVESLSTHLNQSIPLTTGQYMLIGAYSGAATAIVTNPIWVVNTRMMMEDGKTTWGVIKDIIKNDGIRTFFNGVGPALILVINPVLNYTVFEKLREVCLKRYGKITPRKTFLLGALSKIVATTLTFPIITIKSRLQSAKTDNSGVEIPSPTKTSYTPTKRQRIAALLRQFWKVLCSMKIADLYTGWTFKVIQSALQSAFLFVFKDQLFELAVLVIKLTRRTRVAQY